MQGDLQHHEPPVHVQPAILSRKRIRTSAYIALSTAPIRHVSFYASIKRNSSMPTWPPEKKNI